MKESTVNSLLFGLVIALLAILLLVISIGATREFLERAKATRAEQCRFYSEEVLAAERCLADSVCAQQFGTDTFKLMLDINRDDVREYCGVRT